MEEMEELGFDIAIGIIIGLLILTFIGGAIALFDSIYISPIASQNANEYCQQKGFDFYESYRRIGIFSEKPTAIICKYVEQYRKIDVNAENPIIIQ